MKDNDGRERALEDEKAGMIKKRENFRVLRIKSPVLCVRMCMSIFFTRVHVCLHKVGKPVSILRAKPLCFPIHRSLTLPLESQTKKLKQFLSFC